MSEEQRSEEEEHSDEEQRGEKEQRGEEDRMAQEEGPVPRGRLRRWVGSKPGVAAVGAVVGALLAGGAMAWRSGEVPFLAQDMCWGALSSDTAGRLFSDGEIRARELPLDAASGSDRRATECRMQRWEDDEIKWEVSAEVRELDRYHGRDAREWTHEFLSPAMTPLGDDIPGMASDTRAWVALPAGCAGGGRVDEPPTVVSLSSGSLESHENDSAQQSRYRAAMADAIVELTNGVLEEKDCQGRYAAPGKLPSQPQPRTMDDQGKDDEGKDEQGKDEQGKDERLCDLKGTRLPSWLKGSGDYPRAIRSTNDISGPAHSCEYGRDFSSDATRFTTIDDPRLAQVVEPLARRSPVRFRGDGYGAVSGDLSVYMATCQTGQVAFMAQEEDFLGKHASTVELLPAYVAAEAKRIGCGKVQVKGPEPRL
jgi:hypothetical protein